MARKSSTCIIGAPPKFDAAGAVASLHDEVYFRQTRQAVIVSREQLAADLVKPGFEVLPSVAKFIFARRPQHDAVQLAVALHALL